MTTKQNFQIVDIGANGVPVILHPETNADHVLAGVQYKIPTILDINNWIAKSDELVAARKGKQSLKAKIDEIDVSLEASSLLSAIKGVDGHSSGLDADTVDGKHVNDLDMGSGSLWTANKIGTELSKKLNETMVSTTAQPNKILRLDANARLQADVIGNADTATALAQAIRYNFSGDVTGSFVIKGGDSTNQIVNMTVLDDSHNHTEISSGSNSLVASTTDIALFKKNNLTVSKIDASGNFTGSAAKVSSFEVNDSVTTGALWTNDRVKTEIGTAVSELLALSSLNEATGTIKLGGVIEVRYGKISMAGKAEIPVVFGTPFGNKTLFTGMALETAEAGMTCYIKPNTTTKTGVTYTLSKSATSGSLVWFAVGI